MSEVLNIKTEFNYSGVSYLIERTSSALSKQYIKIGKVTLENSMEVL